MRLQTVDLIGVAIDDVMPETIHPSVDANGVIRVVDGAPIYSLRGVMVRDADGQVIKASSVRVRTAPAVAIPAMTAVQCVGCVVTPWVNGGRIALSVLADHVEPAATSIDHYRVTDDDE